MSATAPTPSAQTRASGRSVPIFRWVPGYHRGWLRGDLIAGLTVWAVLVPEALAYATIAGVSPVVGLYAAPGALILYAAFGSSRHLVTGPMAATAALSAAAVGDLAAGGSSEFVDLTVALALVVGIMALVAGLLRLGFLASFISEPVLKGFIVGLAPTSSPARSPSCWASRRPRATSSSRSGACLGTSVTSMVEPCSSVPRRWSS
jgi:sulfate permease, SulP family